MTTPRLAVGEWIPNLQMYAGGSLDYGATPNPISTFPGAVGVSKDPLKNETQSPMIVRSFSCTLNWVDTRDDTTYPLLFDVTIHTIRRGAYKLQQNTVMYAPPTNFVTGLYGSTAAAMMPYVWRLAKPMQMRVGETILFEYGNVSGETVFTWASAQAKASKYSIYCRGRKTGRVVVFGGGGTPSAGERLTGVHQNLTDEDLEVVSITMTVGTATTDRPIFSMEVGTQRLMRGERPLWLFAEPFKHSRLVFDRLPEGGLVFMPGDHFEVTVHDTQYSALNLVLGIEAYQQVA